MMKNFAKGSVALTFGLILVALFYVQPKAFAALFLANESFQSENNIQQVFNEKTTNAVEETSSTEINPAEVGTTTVEISSSLGKFQATAYCLKGITASGIGVRRGIVAADPRILPLGSRISLNAGAYSGTYLVADTGGVIKGRILDIWVPSCGEAVRFGRRSVGVSVLGRGGKKANKAKKEAKAKK